MQTYRAIGRTGVSKRRNHLATYDLNRVTLFIIEVESYAVARAVFFET